MASLVSSLRGIFACPVQAFLFMPTAALHPCSAPGCGVLTNAGRCPAHAKAGARAYERKRGSPSARGYTYRWEQYAAAYKREHPLCVHCQANGRIAATQCVDHKTPVSGPDDPLFWEPTNHQALCHSCHSIKTASEDRGFGNAPRGRGGEDL